VNKVDLWFS